MADEGASLFLCPHCGAFVSDSSSICPNCGNALEEADEELGLEDLQIVEDIVETGPEEQNHEHEKHDSEESQTENDGDDETDAEPVTLFMCSVCGAFTGGDAEVCPQCGASMGDDEEETETLPGIEAETPEADVLDMLVEAEPEPEIEDRDIESDHELLEELKNIESPEDVVSFIDSITEDGEETDQVPEEPAGESAEKTADTMLNDAREMPAEQFPDTISEDREETDELLSQLILADDYDDSREEAASVMKAIVDAPEPEKKADDTIAMCNSCGAFVSESAEVCNVCGQSLKDDKKFVPDADTPAREDRDGKEAENIIRSLLGVDKDVELDEEEDRFQADGSIGLCTVCGAFISENADACTVCGTHIDEMPDFVPSVDIKDKLTDNRALAICPHCGVFVQEGATECMSCAKPIPGGAKLDLVEMDEEEDETDNASNLLRNFLGIEKSLEAEPTRDQSMRGLDICPDCGAFVSLNAVSCSVCGNSLFDGSAPSAEDEKMACPNCGSKIASDSPECPVCGMAFAADELVLEPDGPGEDITDLLEKELEESIRHLELEAGVELPDMEFSEDEKTGDSALEGDIAEETEPAPKIPMTDEAPPEDELWSDDGLEALEVEEDISDMLVELEQEQPPEKNTENIPEELDIEPEPAETTPEPVVPIPASEYQPVEETADSELMKSEDYQEPLEFIDEEPEETDIDELPDEEPEEEFMEEMVIEKTPVDRDLSRFDIEPRPMSKPANWATGIYGSVLSIIFFIGTYVLIPGEYAPGLAVVFGTLLIIGVYLVLTERGTFFRGDVKRGSIFFAGIIFSAGILLHWPMNVLVSDQGILGQPNLDRLMLSASILLVSIGILWIRARVRYVFTWFGGIVLLFLSMVMEYTYTGWGDSSVSPIILVSGLGASLVFISLIFLQYERAISTSIESDIVRGDASYLRHDYKNALTAYDNALTKSQIKRVEILGSPLIEYDVPWYSKGSALILMGNFEEGIKCLDMALAINPNNEVTWVNKGNAHSKLGEQDVAQECYERAIEANPFYEIAWNNLGNVMARQKQYVEALKHYNRAIKINSRYDDAWINKGYVLAKMGKQEQAVKCLNHVGRRADVEISGTEQDAAKTSNA